MCAVSTRTTTSSCLATGSCRNCRMAKRRPLARMRPSILMPVGGGPTENGISTTVQTFVVPELPAGDYFLYAACNEASACGEPLEPTFRVLGAPEGSPLPDAIVELEKFTELDGAGNWAHHRHRREREHRRRPDRLTLTSAPRDFNRGRRRTVGYRGDHRGRSPLAHRCSAVSAAGMAMGADIDALVPPRQLVLEVAPGDFVPRSYGSDAPGPREPPLAGPALTARPTDSRGADRLVVRWLAARVGSDGLRHRREPTGRRPRAGPTVDRWGDRTRWLPAAISPVG